MTFVSSLSAKELQKYHSVVSGGVDVRSHLDLLSWLQGEMQRYLPHDILVAAWGDFQAGAIHLDIVSPLAGVRSQASDPAAMTPLLSDLCRRWREFGRKPFVLNAGLRGFVLQDNALQGAVGQALQQMRGAMVHGIADERVSHDCLYVLFTARNRYDARRRSALSHMLPYIDSALRQISHLPSQTRPRINGHAPAANGAQDARDGHGHGAHAAARKYNLSERESEIMEWVALGKTNPEIAQILQISAFTVKNHMQRLFQKLNVANRAQAVSKLSPRVRHVQD